MFRIDTIQLIKLHLKCLKKDLLMTAILFFMLWGIFLAVPPVSRIHLQFLTLLSTAIWNSWVIPSIFCRFSSNGTSIRFIVWFGRADIGAARWASVPSAWGWKCSSTWAREMHWWTVSCPWHCALPLLPLIRYFVFHLPLLPLTRNFSFHLCIGCLTLLLCIVIMMNVLGWTWQ